MYIYYPGLFPFYTKLKPRILFRVLSTSRNSLCYIPLSHHLGLGCPFRLMSMYCGDLYVNLTRILSSSVRWSQSLPGEATCVTWGRGTDLTEMSPMRVRTIHLFLNHSCLLICSGQAFTSSCICWIQKIVLLQILYFIFISYINIKPWKHLSIHFFFLFLSLN